MAEQLTKSDDEKSLASAEPIAKDYSVEFIAGGAGILIGKWIENSAWFSIMLGMMLFLIGDLRRRIKNRRQQTRLLAAPKIATLDVIGAAFSGSNGGQGDRHGRIDYWSWFLMVNVYVRPSENRVLCLVFRDCTARIEGDNGFCVDISEIQPINVFAPDNPRRTESEAVFERPGTAYCQGELRTVPDFDPKFPKTLSVSMTLRDTRAGWEEKIALVLSFDNARSIEGRQYRWTWGDTKNLG